MTLLMPAPMTTVMAMICHSGALADTSANAARAEATTTRPSPTTHLVPEPPNQSGR